MMASESKKRELFKGSLQRPKRVAHQSYTQKPASNEEVFILSKGKKDEVIGMYCRHAFITSIHPLFLSASFTHKLPQLSSSILGQSLNHSWILRSCNYAKSFRSNGSSKKKGPKRQRTAWRWLHLILDFTTRPDLSLWSQKGPYLLTWDIHHFSPSSTMAITWRDERALSISTVSSIDMTHMDGCQAENHRRGALITLCMIFYSYSFSTLLILSIRKNERAIPCTPHFSSN